MCTHGIEHPKKGKGKRQRRIIRYLACEAKVKALARRDGNGVWKVSVSWAGAHNHLRSEELFRYYSENRRITDPEVLLRVGTMKKAGSSAKGILQHLREETGKRMELRDVHNLLASLQREQRRGKTDEERTVELLREFCATDGNSASVSVNNSSGLVNAVCFQTASQKRLFKEFPEVIMVDTTHGTNTNYYKLFSILVDDVFGKGQYVQHSLVESETMDNLTYCLTEFKESNPAWVNIRVVVTDKGFNEKGVLAESFPDARQLLCQFHVIDYLRKQVGSRCKRDTEDKKEIISALQLMMKAESAKAYSTYRQDMLRSLGNDKNDPFFVYFDANWESCRREWVDYHRDNVPHLNNHTNNRIESGWGNIKQVVEREDPIDELSGTLIMLQEWSQERYMKEFRSLGTRQTPIAEDAADPELLTLAVQLSPHAYRLVRDQYKFACSADAQYSMKIDGARAELRMLSDENEHSLHVVNTNTFQCNCTFMRTLLLPCRHVIFFRYHQSYESAIPPPKFYTARWSLFPPANDISTGHIDVGGALRSVRRSANAGRAMTRDQKYCEARAICQQLQGVMAEQSAEDFKSTFTLLQTIQKLCRAGEVRKLADAMDVSNSQALESMPKKQRQEDNRRVKPKRHLREEATTPKIKQEGDRTNPMKLKFLKSAKKAQDARRKENKTKKAQNLQRVHRRAKLLTRGMSKALPKLEDVRLLLSQQYCFDFAAKMVELLPMNQVEIRAKHTIQRMNVGQRLPEPTNILPRETCAAAVAEIDMNVAGEDGNAVYLARWDEFGYATVEQLNTMILVIDAKEAMAKVKETLQWIDQLLIPSSGVMPPFDDCASLPKLLFTDTVENMTLNKYVISGEEIEGVRLLEFRATEWLGSTCMRAGLIMLARRYVSNGVGFFGPDWYPLSDVARQQKAAATHGAFHATVHHQIGVVNVRGFHWIAFFVDLTSDQANCTIFDPQLRDSSYTELENAVRNVIVPQLCGQPTVNFARWENCKHEDGHSCGV